MTILIACLGNNLRGDDGVGVAVARLLHRQSLPPEVTVEEYGIGGVHLVQTLMSERPHALVVVDCADRGRAPGTVMVIEPEIMDLASLPVATRHDFLADTHYTNPEQALALARGLGALPDQVVLVGIQPGEIETLDQELSPSVQAAVEVAAAEVMAVIRRWARW
ncbi:MAG: hydrogenase maturation protease [Acidimicrobiia bacterium]|nr:hydrogenase maturation protease [Acidimicrobiia bacterium]